LSGDLFPFVQGEWYSVGAMREAATNILEKTGSDHEFAAALRVQDQKLYPWSKAWMEEIFPCWRLVSELGFSGNDRFRWTPVGAADVEFQSSGRSIKVQCTTAYAERERTIAKQRGHLRKLEMEQSNATGMTWLGGDPSRPTTRSVEDDREAWRVGIANALRKKLKPDYRGCWLLIYAPMCQFNLVDGTDFREVIVAATERIGRATWEPIFERLCVLDSPDGAFVDLRSGRSPSEPAPS
jgi:hypothetical protein